MSYTRWSSSDWYVWVEYSKETKKEVLVIWHVCDVDLDPQTFHPQEVRKMLKNQDFSLIRNFDKSVVSYLKRFIEEITGSR